MKGPDLKYIYLKKVVEYVFKTCWKNKKFFSVTCIWNKMEYFFENQESLSIWIRQVMDQTYNILRTVGCDDDEGMDIELNRY